MDENLSPWIRSGRCNNSACVEVQHLPNGGVRTRNSLAPEGPYLTFTGEEWSAFLGGARDGEFDVPEV